MDEGKGWSEILASKNPIKSSVLASNNKNHFSTGKWISLSFCARGKNDEISIN
jgi:hypothetical protein